MRPRTVLYVDHASGLGGAELSLLGLLEQIDRQRYRPVLATVDGPLARRAEALGIPVARLPLRRLKGSPAAPWHWLRGIGAIARLARREEASLVHANVLRAAVYAAPAAALAGRPLIWHVRDILAPGPLTRWFCRRAAAVIAISEAVARSLPCRAKVRVIYNPIATPEPPAAGRSESAGRAALKLPAGRLVASVGRLRAWKGHHRFLDAAARVAPRHPDARFLVIGGRVFSEDTAEAGYAETLETLTERPSLAGRARLLGHREDLDQIWPELSLLVHAAEAEPFGRVVAEAQAAGVPVLGFADGGLPEIVEHARTGILVPAGDAEALARALDELLDDPEASMRLGQGGRRAAERFSPTRHARAVEAVYDSLLGET